LGQMKGQAKSANKHGYSKSKSAAANHASKPSQNRLGFDALALTIRTRAAA